MLTLKQRQAVRKGRKLVNRRRRLIITAERKQLEAALDNLTYNMFK